MVLDKKGPVFFPKIIELVITNFKNKKKHNNIDFSD